MEEVKGTNIPAAVVPFTSEDKYATHSEEYGRGGYRSVDTVAQMNAIPAERRKEGMLVNVRNDKIYTLKNGSFIDAGLGAGSGGSDDSSFYTTTADIIGILDGTADLWDSYNYSKIDELVQNLIAGKYIKYNSYNASTGRRSSSILNILYANSLGDGIEISFIGLNSNGKLVKVHGRESYAETIITNLESSTTPNLDIEIKIERKVGGIYAVFFRIKEKHENGYIFFLRKKKQTYQTASGRKRIGKYVPQNLTYGVIPGISVGNLQTGVWYECPFASGDNLIGKYAKGTTFPNATTTKANTVRFRGNIHANPSIYTNTAGSASPNKRTSVLHMALQYNIINPNYKNRIRENGKMPKPFLQIGRMEKFVGRLRALTWGETPDLYLSVE